jgi:hypothetical protein
VCLVFFRARRFVKKKTKRAARSAPATKPPTAAPPTAPPLILLLFLPPALPVGVGPELELELEFAIEDKIEVEPVPEPKICSELELERELALGVVSAAVIVELVVAALGAMLAVGIVELMDDEVELKLSPMVLITSSAQLPDLQRQGEAGIMSAENVCVGTQFAERKKQLRSGTHGTPHVQYSASKLKKGDSSALRERFHLACSPG